MFYRVTLFLIAALLVVSPSVSIAENISYSFSQQQFLAAFEKLPEDKIKIASCDPFIDPGCGGTGTGGPIGCTDCSPSEIRNILSQANGMFVMIDKIDFSQVNSNSGNKEYIDVPNKIYWSNKANTEALSKLPIGF